MDAFEAIKRRRSVRSYLPDTVPEEIIERILEAGRLAPSAGNIQPWHFILVTDINKRQALSAGRFAKFVSEAPVVIVGCGNERASPKWYAVDTAIAMQNMVIAATSEGLGSCWVGSFDEREVRNILKIPDEYRVIAMLTIGYPRESLDPLEKVVKAMRPRKRLEDIVSSEEYGRPFDRTSNKK